MKRKIGILKKVSALNKYIIISTVILFLLEYVEVIVPVDIYQIGTRLSLIGINATLAGFVFTTYGLIIGFFSNEIIRSLDKYSFLNHLFKNIRLTIFSNLISIVVSFIMIFNISKGNTNIIINVLGITINNWKLNVISNQMDVFKLYGYIEIFFCVLSLILFLRIVYYLQKLINIQRRN